MSKYAFDMADHELVDALIKASTKTGTSCSGLVIDCMASVHVQELNYLRRAVLSRLNDQTPPFKRGDRLLIKKDYPGKVLFSTYRRGFSEGNVRLIRSTTLSVFRMWYDGDGNWLVSFEESGEVYKCEYFEPAPAENPAIIE